MNTFPDSDPDADPGRSRSRIAAPGEIRQPPDGTKFPRFAGSSTFARLPRIDEVSDFDIAIIGAPFDAGVSFRPGARFGPTAIREASRNLRPGYHPELGVAPFRVLQVVDAGDVPCSPFSAEDALGAIATHVRSLAENGRRVVTLGGDHTVSLGAMRAMAAVHGPLAVIHLDAHLDTWDTYFRAEYTHGTFLRRACEEGLLIADTSTHIGIRGPLYDAQDIADDKSFGFSTIRMKDFDVVGVDEIVSRVRRRVGDCPVYLSIDIDVLDPAYAPGTGTPEIGGLTSRELLRLLRALPSEQLVGLDVVEVSPPYDHAEITSLAAATVAFDVMALMATSISSASSESRANAASPSRMHGSQTELDPLLPHPSAEPAKYDQGEAR